MADDEAGLDAASAPEACHRPLCRKASGAREERMIRRRGVVRGIGRRPQQAVCQIRPMAREQRFAGLERITEHRLRLTDTPDRRRAPRAVAIEPKHDTRRIGRREHRGEQSRSGPGRNEVLKRGLRLAGASGDQGEPVFHR
jgi:hypothetical protein